MEYRVQVSSYDTFHVVLDVVFYDLSDLLFF